MGAKQHVHRWLNERTLVVQENQSHLLLAFAKLVHTVTLQDVPAPFLEDNIACALVGAQPPCIHALLTLLIKET